MYKDIDRQRKETNLSRQEDYLTALLLDFYRSIENEVKWSFAAKAAKNHLKQVFNVHSPKLDKRLVFLASQLKNDISSSSIRYFSKECLKCVAQAIPSFDYPKTETNLDNARFLQKKALKNIRSAIKSGHSAESAVVRAVNSLAEEKKIQQQKEQRGRALAEHPLKDTLELLCASEKKMPREDIRNHLLNIKSSPNQANRGQGQLYSVLKKAQAFSMMRLHYLMGDELFFLCRPLGFLDRLENTILIEVPTSSHLNALVYKKVEILKALKADSIFKNAQNIRFVVRQKA